MKATELMLGDWVLDTYTNKPMRIESINTNMGEGLEPIPLTAEILEKNGFTKCGDENTFTCNDDKWTITFVIVDGGCPILTIEEVSQHFEHNLLNLRDEIYNVHELQHALRLCGIEKEIQL